jgi:hypothetical protein
MDIEAVTKTVEIKGERFPVVDAGTGPVVVLLHGFPDSRFLWRHQIPALSAAGFRVIAPDLRGYGDAPRPTQVRPYRRPCIVADVSALDALEVSRSHLSGMIGALRRGDWRFLSRKIRTHRGLVGWSARQSRLGHRRATGEIVVLRFLHEAGHRRTRFAGRQLETVSAVEPRSRRSQPTSARPGPTWSVDGGAELVSRCVSRRCPRTRRACRDYLLGPHRIPVLGVWSDKTHSCSNRRWRCRAGRQASWRMKITELALDDRQAGAGPTLLTSRG